MIVSASFRTDIPAFHHRWFRERLGAGFARVVNPYGGPPSRVDLTPAAVDGFVFWTRNIVPFLPALEETAELGIPFVAQHTVTGLPSFLEPAGDEARAIDGIRAVARRWGPRVAVWRYDPIVHTGLTDDDHHLRTFGRLARALRGAVDEVTISFLQPYRKARPRLDRACRAAGTTWRVPAIDERRDLARRLAEIAADEGMRLTGCSQPDLDERSGATPGRCVDPERLSDMAGRTIRAKLRPNRPGCGCALSRDIGAYDSCPAGCVYCYAVADSGRVRERLGAREPGDEFLVGRKGNENE